MGPSAATKSKLRWFIDKVIFKSTDNDFSDVAIMIVRNKKKFLTGLIGLLFFLIALTFWIFPVGDHKPGLEWADNLFNQLAKNSAYYIPLVPKKAEKFRGVTVDLSVNPRWPGADKLVAKIVTTNGISASAIGDGRVRIEGDLELLSLAASTDAALLFKGKEEVLQNKYGLSGKEVIYYWWTAFDDLIRRYVQLNRPSEAEFTKFMTTRILEPSYNFAGIESKNISENIGIVAFLLVIYIFYTVWYGFSIMYLFEGFGIGATKAAEKKEA